MAFQLKASLQRLKRVFGIMLAYYKDDALSLFPVAINKKERGIWNEKV